MCVGEKLGHYRWVVVKCTAGIDPGLKLHADRLIARNNAYIAQPAPLSQLWWRRSTQMNQSVTGRNKKLNAMEFQKFPNK